MEKTCFMASVSDVISAKKDRGELQVEHCENEGRLEIFSDSLWIAPRFEMISVNAFRTE